MSDSKTKKTKDSREPGTSGFPEKASVLPGDLEKDDTAVGPCTPGAPCSGQGGDGSDEPNTGTGGGKSGLSIRSTSASARKAGATEAHEHDESEAHAHQPGRMVMFYLETDNVCLDSLGMDEFFTNLAQRAKAKA